MLEGSWAPYRTVVTVTKDLADHGPHEQLQCVRVLCWDASIDFLVTHKAIRQPLLDDAAPTGALQPSVVAPAEVRHVCRLTHQDNDRCLGNRALAALLDDGDRREHFGGGHLAAAVLLPLKLC